jgi:hypothetical protein
LLSHLRLLQGCQIFLGTTYQTGKKLPNDHEIYQIATKYAKWPQNIPNCHEIYQMAQNIPNGHKIYQIATEYTKLPQNVPYGRKIDQTAMKYAIIVNYKTLENLPKLGYLV